MNKRRVQLEDALPKFETFGEDQWCAWIESLFAAVECDRLLVAAPTEPHLELGTEEIDAVLQGVYEALETTAARNNFAKAIASLYESTGYFERQSETLYVLLSLIAAIKPRNLKDYLRGQLLSEVALHMRFSESQDSEDYGVVEQPADLHTLLLSAIGEYSKDDVITQYILSSSQEIEYYPYLLVCFRLLASGGDPEAFNFIERIIRLTRSTSEAMELSMEVAEEIKRRTSHKQFTEWYTEHACDLAERWPTEFGLFEESLVGKIFPARIEVFNPATDKHLALLALQLNASKVKYKAEHILQISRLHEYFGPDTIVNALRNVRRRGQPLSVNGEAWEFITVSELVMGGASRTHKREIAIPGNKNDFIDFDARNEPKLDEIFERLKTVSQLGAELDDIEEDIENYNREEESLVLTA